MQSFFPLAPRYRLDDEMPWLEGIDPSRHYWIALNSSDVIAPVPGLLAASMEEFRQAILGFRALQPGEQLLLTRTLGGSMIHCISRNCYALETELNGALVWHLFDQETLESLLMTSHPDWQAAPKDIELGRQLLMRSLQQSVAA